MVDDEDRVRNVLCDLLAACGWEADGAASAALGLDLFAQGAYDVVLTDFLMNGGNGLDLIERVRRADPTVGVIMLTGAGADLEAPSRRLEFTVLRKPIPLDGLRAAVSQALGRRSRESPAALTQGS